MNKPFLKWVGGKGRSMSVIQANLPKGDRLVEPFAGSGSVSLATHFDRYLLSDVNPDLYAVWQAVLQRPHDFITDVENIFEANPHDEEECYYRIRDRFNDSENAYERACLLIYLNRNGYNGLCRYNNLGRYNVPWGRYKKVHIPSKEIMSTHEHLKGKAEIVLRDYNIVLTDVQQGDVIYADPPYLPLNSTSDFTKYHTAGFGAFDHERLAEHARVLREEGIPMLVSNNDCPLSREIYRDADEIVVIPIKRTVAADTKSRGQVNELLFIYKVK